jgi:short-subunit dehydrogenase
MTRTVLVVGNSDGIGAALTRALLTRGDRVVGLSRSPSPLGPSGPRHEMLDVSSPELTNVVRRLDQEERFDACVYCAGIGSELKLPDLSREAHVVEVNLVGMMRTMEALVPRWIDERRGHFVGLSSLADSLYLTEAPSYSASKAAFSNYLVSMGFKLRSHSVRVTNVRFGFVDTKMARSPIKPLMMTPDKAAAHVLRCLDTKPRQLTVPKAMGALVALLRLGQSLRVWTRY